MSREEDVIRATTRAIAATVRDVPPLELEPAPGELWSPGHGPHRRRPGGSGRRPLSWLAPVAAAAAVVAVAVTLVIARGIPNGSMVPQTTPGGAGPGGVPRYYVALDPVTGRGSAHGLLAGDLVTGQTLAVIPPPAHMSFESVTAAADDRTFLAFATVSGGSWSAGRWYELALAPGTAHPVSLTSTAIAPQSGVIASALSGSGKELAVAEDGPAKGQQRVVVFSVATGRPLRAWSTQDAAVRWEFGPVTQQALLTWIDGDRAIAFTDRDPGDGNGNAESVRRLNLGGPGGDGDLIADSQVIWSIGASQSASGCGQETPLVSADGQAIACSTADVKRPSAGHVQWTFAWRVFRASAQAPVAAGSTIAYQDTQQELVPTVATGAWSQITLWISPSGTTLIGEWGIEYHSQATTSASTGGSSSSTPVTLPVYTGFYKSVQVGVMSHGTFTPLRVPSSILLAAPQAIAW